MCIGKDNILTETPLYAADRLTQMLQIFILILYYHSGLNARKVSSKNKQTKICESRRLTDAGSTARGWMIR